MGGGDKCRRIVGGRSIIARTVATLAPQVDALAISANGDRDRFADLALPILPDPILPDPILPDPVLADPVPGHPGPLAGILAGLDWAAAAGHAWLLSVPGDCPFLPPDLATRLHAARLESARLHAAHPATVATAASAGQTHPVIALWPTACRQPLRDALAAGHRKVAAFAARHATALAEWPTDPVDPFLNVNTPADLARADALAAPNAAPNAAP